MTDHAHYPSHPLELAGHDAFKEARRDGLYSTDSVAILQLSRFSSPLSVYREKVEPLEPGEVSSLQAWLGWRLESSLAQLYAERYGVLPRRESGTWTHPELPFIKTHLDFSTGSRVRGNWVLVEAKTRTMRSGAWGPDGGTKVPADVWVQCQHELMVTGAGLVRVAVLFGLHTFAVFEVWPDQLFQEKLTLELDRFWREHVLAGVPPELTAAAVDVSYSKRHQLTDESLRQVTPAQEQLFTRRRLAGIAVSQAKAAQEALDAQVRELIGERLGLVGTFGQVTYKPTKGETDWKLLAGTYLKAAQELAQLLELTVATYQAGDVPPMVDAMKRLELIRQQLDAAPGLYTKPGSRRLAWTWSEGSEQ